ncbi:hypothetical protein F4677DRAFT_166876 [Hypoxylon crocopeplum]|nr:hypothetical protein F4677DRAFT_166876 [Hypoxylon crocopeplum]
MAFKEVLRFLRNPTTFTPDQVEELADWADTNGNTALHLAASLSLENEATKLLETAKWKEMVNATNKFGRTPLHTCCEGESWNKKIAQRLLDNGADANAADGWGRVPLHVAVVRGNAEAVELLLEEGKADPDRKNLHWGATSLHMAANRAHFEIVELLLKKGANPKLTTWGGETVLYWILFRAEWEKQESNESIVEVVNACTSDSEEDDENDDANEIPQQSPEGGASDFDRTIAKILEWTERWPELLKVACRADNEDLVHYSVRKLYPTQPKRWGRLRNIWLAMSAERFEKLEDILRAKVRQKGTDAAKRGCETWNALDLAAYLGKCSILVWLLRSKRWSKAQKDHAKGLLDEGNALTNNSVWSTSFIQCNRMRSEEDYYYPNPRDGLDGYQASIVDFYTDDKQHAFIYDTCEFFHLLYDGERNAPQARMEAATSELSKDYVLEPSTYKKDNLSFRWIHLPANCMEWMKDTAVITYLSKQEDQDQIKDAIRFFQQSWHELPENDVEGKCMSPKCLRKSPSIDGAERQLALYMPYITFGYSNANDRDKELIEYYEASESIVHKSRTLDEYFHGSTPETKNRDLDQVVSRWIRDRKENRDSSDILRVDQLWLWVLDDKTIVSCGTQRAGDGSDPIFEGVLDRLAETQKMLDNETMPSSADGLVKFIASFYVNIFDNLSLNFPVGSGGSQQASLYEMFAGSIERNNEIERHLRKDFGVQMQMGEGQSRVKVTDPRKETESLHDSIVKTLDILMDIRDIRDELNIIRSVTQTQKVIWSQLFGLDSNRASVESQQETKQVYPWRNTDPDYVLSRISDLLRIAAETQRNIESVLELRMNQLSLYEAEESRRQGQTLMVFTIVTVIFLPLSFLSSLFALNVTIFPHSGDNLLYQPGWIFGIIFGSTAAFLVLLLLVVRGRGGTKWIMETVEEYRNWQTRRETRQTLTDSKTPFSLNHDQPLSNTHDSRKGILGITRNITRAATGRENTTAIAEQGNVGSAHRRPRNRRLRHMVGWHGTRRSAE